MKYTQLWIIVAIIIASFIIFKVCRNYGMTTVTASNGKSYYVKNMNGKQQAAELLATLEKRVDVFLQYCKNSEYGNDKRIKNIIHRWNGTLSETRYTDFGEAAYTLHKKDISICLRNKAGHVENADNAFFVLLHELTHVASDCIDHPKEFWVNNRWVLHVAEQSPAYTYQNFEQSPSTYCNHPLQINPSTCLKKGSCTLE